MMTLDADEIMRRFLLHVLPAGFHRIRHYGLLANGSRKADLALVRKLLAPIPVTAAAATDVAREASVPAPTFVCRHCGAAMAIIETFVPGQLIRAPPPTGP